MAGARHDWQLLEEDWRRNEKSLAQMAEDYLRLTGKKISRNAIQKHFRDQPRDLAKKIKAATERKVVEARNKLTEVEAKVTAARRKLTDKDIVEARSDVIARIRTEQEDQATDNRRFIADVLEGLKEAYHHPEKLIELVELVNTEHPDYILVTRQFEKMIALGEMVDILKKLLELWIKLAEAEARIYGIDKAEGDKGVWTVKLEPDDIAL